MINQLNLGVECTAWFTSTPERGHSDNMYNARFGDVG